MPVTASGAGLAVIVLLMGWFSMRVVMLIECVTPLATRLVMGALRAVRGPVPACHIHPFLPLLGRGRGRRPSSVL